MLSLLLPLALAATAAGAPGAVGISQSLPPQHQHEPRTLPNSPSGSYTPATVSCPSNLSIRSASGLSPNETAWLRIRRNATIQPMIDLLTRANLTGFSASDYINKALAADPTGLANVPNVAIAVSGGGYRALMNGAGFLSAADSRTPGTTSGASIGGLLQSATYLAGLSGGSWLVSSLFANDFVGVRAMQLNGTVWQFGKNIFEGPEAGGVLGVANTAGYWADIQSQVSGKKDAGFETSITDYWGRALSYQMVGAPDGGPGFVFSGIAAKSEFTTGQTPFPIVVADGRTPGSKLVNGNSTVFEFNPFEMGSFDPTLYGFAPTAYLASNFSNGTLAPNARCVQGFDQVGFVMGTSSSLFNEFLLTNMSISGVPSLVTDAIRALLTEIGDDNNDIAQYVPNPFLGYRPGANPTAGAAELDLVDGGEDLQNVPLTPLLQPARAVDVIFAVDSSADTIYNWPNGTALSATFDRSKLAIANGTLFPSVPDVNTMVNLGLNNRPTFFGCDASNFSSIPSGSRVPPLLVYLPNAPYTAPSNVSTFDPTYANAQRDDIIKNGFNSATQGNGTLDGEWPACVACAVLSRSLARTKTAVPDVCARCFARYCWNGTVSSKAPSGEYQPAFKIGNQASATSGAESAIRMGWAGGLIVSLAALVAMV